MLGKKARMKSVAVLADKQGVRKRVVTSVLLILLTGPGILMLPVAWFPWVSLAVWLLAIWEWARLIEANRVFSIAYSVAMAIACVLALSLPRVSILCFGALCWCVIAALFLYGGNDFNFFYTAVGSIRRYVQAVWGIGLFIPAWIGIQAVYHQGAFFLLWVLLLIACMDTGAYYIGKQHGRHRLAPSISPGKTWEGVGGGGVCVLSVAVTIKLLFPEFVVSWGLLGSLLAVIIVFSVVGDLWESVQKRLAEVKDSGYWLPGHGGLLDRIDGVLAVIPMVAFVLYLWGG